MPQPLRNSTAGALALIAVAAFHVAYLFERLAGVIVVYLACLFLLAWVGSSRWAFYLGMAIGISVAAPHLWFFQEIFGPAAVGLWAVFGVWTGLYLLLAHLVVTRWPRAGGWWLPVVWFAIEYFRSELNPLRFAWLSPGFALAHPWWLPFAACGVYGFSLLCMTLIACVHAAVRRRRLAPAAAVVLATSAGFFAAPDDPRDLAAPLVVGIQMEWPAESETVTALDEALRAHPNADLFVLSEYAFNGPISEEVLDWCRSNRRHLVAGGKESVESEAKFRNTAFVVSPEGEVVFRQVKSVPVQFINDGLPADRQQLWESPWGRIGIAICYDLSYARVIDQLIDQGAQALIIPTMDAIDWGAHEHWLHSKVAPVRAREYGVPIFRLCSSGVSQFVDRGGRVLASAPFPGQGERLTGPLPLARPGSLPLDRYLALPALVALAGLLLSIGWTRNTVVADQSRR